MKYITLFETTAAYNTATLDLPNVSLIEETNGVAYHPYIPETKVVAKYNVTDTSNPTALRTNYENNIFKTMEIDGVMLDELVTDYTFDTTGVHTVKYELYDETKLGNQAPVFDNSNLIECIIPDSVISIGNNTFYECSGLTNCTIGSGVTNICAYAFYNCTSLTTIDIPDSVTSIDMSAFRNCSGLTSCTIGSGVTSIGKSAFYECSSLTSINIPSGVTSIADAAFAYCTGLTSINIPSGVTSIADSAFASCSTLASIEIPDSVISIGNSAFFCCVNLTSIISNATTAPSIQSNTFQDVKTDGVLTVSSGSTGYDAWMRTGDYYLGKYNWTKVEQ